MYRLMHDGHCFRRNCCETTVMYRHMHIEILRHAYNKRQQRRLLALLGGFGSFRLFGTAELLRAVSDRQYRKQETPTFLARFLRSFRSLREALSTFVNNPDCKSSNSKEIKNKRSFRTRIKRYLGSNFFCDASSSQIRANPVLRPPPNCVLRPNVTTLALSVL